MVWSSRTFLGAGSSSSVSSKILKTPIFSIWRSKFLLWRSSYLLINPRRSSKLEEKGRNRVSVSIPVWTTPATCRKSRPIKSCRSKGFSRSVVKSPERRRSRICDKLNPRGPWTRHVWVVPRGAVISKESYSFRYRVWPTWSIFEATDSSCL